MPEITTQSGQIITTESGQILLSNVATSNYDTQLFDFSVDLLSSLLWEYNNAEKLQAIIQSKQDWYTTNQTEFWQDWITNVFNLQTANAFGLEVWSIILGFPLFINLSPTDNDKNCGFGPNRYNFGNGNFVKQNGGSIVLPLATNRLALQLRYFQLCSSGTVPEINRFLNFVFSQYNGSEPGQVFLIDNHDMTQTYYFLFPVTWDLQFLFTNFDILPRPSGVGTAYKDTTLNYWGFGPNRLNFTNGNFAPPITFDIP